MKRGVNDLLWPNIKKGFPMSKCNSRHSALFTASLLSLCYGMATAAPALAQEPQAAAEGEEAGAIVVTARRRSEALLDVPMAITAVTSEQLEKSGTNGLEDLAKTTPGLGFQSLGGTYQAPVIRGLAQVDQTAQIGNVGVFIDGIYLNNRSGLEFGFLDLERVEVVKGPQSAMYGRNTFSGAINYVTKGPKLGRWEGYVTGEAGQYNRFSGQGSLNIPIGDIAALRVFGGIGKFDGTIDNERDGEKIGGFYKRSNYGASLMVQPIDRLTVKLFGMRTDTDEKQAAFTYMDIGLNNCGSESPGGINGPRWTLYCGRLPNVDSVNVDTDIATGLTGHSYLAYATADYEFDFATLTGTYGHTEASFGQMNDTAADPLAITRPLLTGSPLSQQGYLTAVGLGSKENSYELKLTSPGDQPLSWMAGLYAYDSSINDVLSSVYATLADPNVLVPYFGIGKTVELVGKAIYGQVSYELFDGFTFGVEGRYTHETQEFYGSTLTDGVYVTGIRGSTKYNYFTPKFTADYQINPDFKVYGTIAKGYKIGGFNSNAAGLPQFEYRPETNWTYELGIKGRLLDNKLVYTADVFYVDWQNIQTQMNIPSSTIAIVGNNKGATSKGIELDLTYYFQPTIWLRAAGALLDPKYKEGTLDGEITSFCGLLTGTSIPTPGCSNDVGGKQLARTSKEQFTITGNWGIPISNDWEAFVRADYSYQSAKHSLSLGQDSQGKIELVNARIGLSAEKYELAFWVRNLFDVDYIARATTVAGPVSEGSTTGGVSQTRLYPGERRTWGVRATFRF